MLDATAYGKVVCERSWLVGLMGHRQGVEEAHGPPTWVCVVRRWGDDAKDVSGRRMQPMLEREPSGAAAAVRSEAGEHRPVGDVTCTRASISAQARLPTCCPGMR